MAHDHSHDHGLGCCGDHSHEAPAELARPNEPMDHANKALADALKISFRVLSVIMLLLLAAFLFSGVFQVTSEEKAVVLRFGQIVGSGNGGRGTVLGPGIHLSWPYPVDQVVRVPTKYRDLEISSAWYFETPEDRLKAPEQVSPGSDGLRPGWDGALMTGDRGLIHIRWKCKYSVPPGDDDAVLDYVANVSDVESVLKTAIDNAAIKAAATMNVEAIWVNKDNTLVTEVTRQAQQTLTELKTGIFINSLTIDGNRPPLQTLGAFNDVISAQQEADKERTEAQRQRSLRLLETAGANWQPVKEAIDAYDKTLRDNQPQQAEKIYANIDALLTSDTTTGKAKEMIYQARSYSAAMVQKAAQDQDRFNRLLPAYLADPEFTVRRLWDEAQQTILSGETIEKTHVPPGIKYVLQLGQDPKVQDHLKQLEAEATRNKVQEERRPR